MPWYVKYVRDTFYVMTGRDYYVARCVECPGDLDEHGNEQYTPEANAAHIVQCVNQYPALLQQRNELLEALKGFMESPVWRSVCDYLACGCETSQLYAAGEKAIASVEQAEGR